MKKPCLLIISSLLPLLSVNTGAQEVGERSRLHSNPFIQPEWRLGQGESGGTAEPRAAAVDLELRGTLMSPSDPMANIGGVILGIGEEVNGHRLVSVEEWRVIVEKNGVRTTLSLHDE